MEGILDNLAEGVSTDWFNWFYIAQLGPFVLGDTTWQLFGGAYFRDWDMFTECVEARYGLTKDQLEDAFFNMQPASGEDADAFVLWVEDTHASLGMDMRSVLHAFFPGLPAELQQKIETSIKMSHVWGFAWSLDWEVVVNYAKH